MLRRYVFPTKAGKIIKSPKQAALSPLSTELSSLPYPPDALPGGRDVPTPYGNVHVFEFGPSDGERVLFLHGLSMPCLSGSRTAVSLADKGYRVMLFDLFGRGWSDTPDPEDVDYDERLFVSQIMMVVASSEVSWTGNAMAGGNGGFHIIGYSFGGGLAANFASWFPHLVRSLVLVAPSGLLKRSDISWSTRWLYSRFWPAERLLHQFYRRRLEPKYTAPEEGSDGDGKKTGDPWDDAIISPGRPIVTVASITSWHLRYHQGFVPAIISSLRYGPIYERYDEWRKLGSMLSARRDNLRLPGLIGGKVLLIFGSSDQIVQKDKIMSDMEGILGGDACQVEVLDAGHEVGITRGAEVAEVAIKFWRKPS
ncbi:putative rab proteins geranylgeranyltransferase component a [Diaporthe ampelina]|uniref:Putative rab proteins geranylgeranyltransferase component a n=1 Tax=Diaporthe ampelina TaxID=1214573 RepID=A0A0G2I1B7_9PEZI|nr:putative rab proteins geranylgeranyltransferase component a [Diaporthe ampelina]